MSGIALGVLTISVVLALAVVSKTFAAKTTMMEAMMLGTLAVETIATEAVVAKAMMARALAVKTVAAKAVVAGAMMARALAVETIAAKAVVAEAMMARALAVETVAAKAVAAEAMMARALTVETIAAKAVMIEAVPREALPFRTAPLAVMPGKPLMIELQTAGALPGAVGMMETVHGVREHVFADFHGDLLFLRLADDRKSRRAIFAGRVHQNLKLPGIDDLLIVIELQHIETLEASRGRRAIGQNTFHHQTEAFGQAELRSEDGRHRGGHDADIGRRFWRRERRALELAGAFGAIRSTISPAPAFLPGAIGAAEMFTTFAGKSGIRGALTVSGIRGVLRALSIVLARRAV
jgi:hypothetical protein